MPNSIFNTVFTRDVFEQSVGSIHMKVSMNTCIMLLKLIPLIVKKHDLCHEKSLGRLEAQTFKPWFQSSSVLWETHTHITSYRVFSPIL